MDKETPTGIGPAHVQSAISPNSGGSGPLANQTVQLLRWTVYIWQYYVTLGWDRWRYGLAGHTARLSANSSAAHLLQCDTPDSATARVIAV